MTILLYLINKNMKTIKTLGALLIAILAIILNSCTSFWIATSNTNKWIAQEIRPSEIKRNGEIFLEGKLSDGSTYFVFHDDTVEIDQYYYYNSLMQDFGWRENDNEWIGSEFYSRRYKLGYIYINPSRRVAIYFYPKGTFDAFKVKINN